MLNRFWLWCKESATIVWARLLVVGSAVLGALTQFGADPNVTSLIQTFLTPRNVTITLAVIGIITEVARRRTAGKP